MPPISPLINYLFNDIYSTGFHIISTEKGGRGDMVGYATAQQGKHCIENITYEPAEYWFIYSLIHFKYKLPASYLLKKGAKRT